MRNRDPRKNKARDLRRIARSNPSIFHLFHKYHPEVEERKKQLREEWRDLDDVWYWWTSEYTVLLDLEYDWAAKIAGYWNAIGGSPPSSYRRMRNRLHRARQKAALQQSIQNCDLEDFDFPRKRRDIRWLWY